LQNAWAKSHKWAVLPVKWMSVANEEAWMRRLRDEYQLTGIGVGGQVIAAPMWNVVSPSGV